MLGTPEMIFIGAVVLLVFGTGKLKGLGKDLGDFVREFRSSLSDPVKNATTEPVKNS